MRASAVGRAGGGLRFRLRASGVEAAARLSGVLLAAAWAQAWGGLADRLRGPEARAARREARRARALSHLVRVLGGLKGVFTKAGQFASLRHDVLPPSAHAALRTLQDRVPPLPFAPVRRLLESELGAPLEAHFRHFEPAAFGAASIAQVHRAVLPDGTPVAVKVQYPWIRASLRSDLALARRLVRVWTWWTGRALDEQRMFREFAESLAEELDFAREARVAGEIASNLASDAQIVVPCVVPSHSTSRVLTMSYHDAARIDDEDALDRLGVDRRQVLEIVARAYARQVFADGLFHADPHPGNLFVLDEAAAREHPRVLFVDFGLSKRLDPALRAEMRRGIYALLQRDLEGFLQGMRNLGMIAPGTEPQVRDAVTTMFERITETSGGRGALGIGGGQVLALKDEAKALLQSTPGLQLPNELLLYAKTLSYLFALGDRLAPDVDLMRISTPYLLQFLAGRD